MSTSRGPGQHDHQVFDELAVGWALHALEPEDEALFARHLPDCTRCARTVADAGEVMGALATDLPPAEPSEDLRARLRAAVEETEQTPTPALPPDPPSALPGRNLPEDVPVTPRNISSATRFVPPPAPPAVANGRPGWRRRLPHLLAAAALAVLMGLGAWNVVLSAQREQAQATAATDSRVLHSLMAPGQATIAPVSTRSGHAVATVVARQGRAHIVTWGLAVNNTHATTYVLWGMRDGATVPLGTFDVTQSRMDLRTVWSDKTALDSFPVYAISLEQGRTAPDQPTDVVAKGQVAS